MRARTALFFSAILPAMLGGCGGGGPDMVAVTGVCRTADGEIVTEGELIFHPEAEEAPPSVGRLGSDGKFELKSARGPGAAVDRHSVIYVPPEPSETADGTMGPPSKFRGYAVPEGFEIVITPGESDIEITLEKK